MYYLALSRKHLLTIVYNRAVERDRLKLNQRLITSQLCDLGQLTEHL